MLDITTSSLSLAGIENQIEQFADHDVLKAILDQVCCCRHCFEQQLACCLAWGRTGNPAAAQHRACCMVHGADLPREAGCTSHLHGNGGNLPLQLAAFCSAVRPHVCSHGALQGCDAKEYGRQYESKLRAAELESIQDYIAESDNLVVLHEQVVMRRGHDLINTGGYARHSHTAFAQACHTLSIHALMASLADSLQS